MDTYDRLARRGFHRWWTPPLAALAALIGVAVVAIATYAVAGIVGALSGRRFDDELMHHWGPVGDTMLLLVSLALLTPLAMVLARLVQRRPAGSVSSVTGRIRWRWMAICFGIALPLPVLLGIVMVIGADADVIDPGRLAVIAAALVVLVPLQAAGEEYLCRGFLLQTFGAYHRWVGIVVSALVFALLHGFGTWSGMIALTVSGVVWALLTIFSGGLEAAVAAHASSNLMVFLSLAATGGLDVVDDASAADADWAGALLLGGFDVGYALVVVLVLLGLRRWLPHLAPARVAPVAGAPVAGAPRVGGPEGTPTHGDGSGYSDATSACLARTASAASFSAASSDSVSGVSTTRFTPPAPSSASTPRYTPEMPYSPSTHAHDGMTAPESSATALAMRAAAADGA